MSYTKGPWLVNGPWHIQAPTQPGELPIIVAHVVKVREHNGGRKTREANADLLAAAPELLEALEAVNNVFENYGKSRLPEYVRKEFAGARAAIAKARRQ